MELGWYLAKVLSVNVSGVAKLRYKKNRLIEDVNLASMEWIPTEVVVSGLYSIFFVPPSMMMQPDTVHSKPHKVKRLHRILPSFHGVSQVDVRCRDVGLCIRPDKYYSLYFNGKKNPIGNSSPR